MGPLQTYKLVTDLKLNLSYAVLSLLDPKCIICSLKSYCVSTQKLIWLQKSARTCSEINHNAIAILPYKRGVILIVQFTLHFNSKNDKRQKRLRVWALSFFAFHFIASDCIHNKFSLREVLRTSVEGLFFFLSLPLWAAKETKLCHMPLCIYLLSL